MKKTMRKVSKHVSKISKSSVKKPRSRYGSLAAFVGIVLFITFALLFVARTYSKGPFTNLVAQTIGVNQIEVDVDDGSIQEEVPSINITTEAYEAAKEAQSATGTKAQVDAVKKNAKELIKKDVQTTAVVKTKVVAKPSTSVDDKPKASLPNPHDVPKSGVTCSGSNGTTFRVGDTVVGLVINGKNSVMECTDNGTWKTKLCGGVPCTQEDNASSITVKPTYQLVAEAKENDTIVQFNCNRGGSIYSTGSRIAEEKIVCKAGKWVEDVEYLAALASECKSPRIWDPVKHNCNAAVAVASCNFSKSCSGTMLSTCAKSADGKISYKVSQCASKKCNAQGTDCEDAKPEVTTKSAGCKTGAGNKQISVQYMSDGTKKEQDCGSNGCNGVTGYCNAQPGGTDNKKGTQIGGDTNDADDCLYGVAGPGKTALYACNKKEVNVENPQTGVPPAGYKNNASGKLGGGASTENVNDCRWGGYISGANGATRAITYTCYSEGEKVQVSEPKTVEASSRGTNTVVGGGVGCAAGAVTGAVAGTLILPIFGPISTGAGAVWGCVLGLIGGAGIGAILPTNQATVQSNDQSLTYSCDGNNISKNSSGASVDCADKGGCNPVTGKCNNGNSIYLTK